MNNYIISIITWLPAVGAVVILAVMRKGQSNLIKKVATAWFALDFIASLWLFKYDRAVGGMQFLEDHQWVPIIGARYQMGVDGVSVLLITLTTILGFIAVTSATINVVGGFIITDRMLRMFKRTDRVVESDKK